MDLESILPPVINNEYKNLEDQIRAGRESLAEIALQTEEQKRRTDLIKEHLQQAQQLAAFNQQVFGAVTSEAEAEKSILRIRTEERDRTMREVAKINRDVKAIHQKLENSQRTLLDKRRSLQDLQSALVWESEACQEWLKRTLGTTQRHLDSLQTQKEAATFFRKLNCEVQKLQGELVMWKKNKEDICHTHHNLQAEFCRTSDDFSSNHLERQNALKLWEDSVKALQAVETDLDMSSKELESLRSDWSRQQLLLLQTQESISRENQVQGALLQQADQLNSAAVLLRQQLSEDGIAIRAELQGLILDVTACSLDERSLRGQLSTLRCLLVEKNLLIASLQERQETLTVGISKPGSTEVAKELNLLRNLIEREKISQERCSVSRLKVLCGSKESFMRTLRDQRTAMYSQLQNCDGSYKMKESQVHNKNKVLEEKMTVLANLDSKLQILEKRYKRMVKGSDENKNRTAFNKDLENLELSLTSKIQNKRALDSRLQQINEECQKVLKSTSKLCCEQSSLEESVTVTEQDTDASESGLRRLRQSNKELSIDNSLLQVTVRQMQFLLEDSNQEIMNMQEQHQELQTSFSRKLKNGKELSDSLQSRLNLAQHDKHKLSLRLQKDKVQLEGFKARFHVLVSSLPGDLKENCPSAVIDKALELKKCLLEQEDAVDANVRQGQRDLFQLEGYVEALESANGKTRSRLGAKDSESERITSELEKELKNILQTLYEKRRSLRSSEEHLNGLKTEAKELSSQRQSAQSLATEASLRESKARLVLEEQERKMERAENRTEILASKGDNETQKWIKLLLLRRIQQLIKNTLTHEARKYPDFYMTLHNLIH